MEKCKFLSWNLYLKNCRNVLAFTAGIEIAVDDLLLLQSLGIHYVGGETYRQTVLPTACLLAGQDSPICAALTAVAGAEPIALQLQLHYS